MRFPQFLLIAALIGTCFAEVPGTTLRGKLIVKEGKPSAIETAERRVVALEADKDSESVLQDARLAGSEMELRGHFAAPDRFVVDHFHTKSMFVLANGKPMAITYWCDVCSIRTYTPGKCVCCQKETDVDLRDPRKPE